MADVNLIRSAPPEEDGETADAASAADEAALFELVELMFFAYRDFISGPDAILAQIGFGRAHHRVLHFVNRNPGLRVADLLDILRITKQSLGRVLRQLVAEGYIDQTAGASDRRQRLLHPTPRGRELALRLARPQLQRFATAIDECGPADADAARRFLARLVDGSERARVARLLAGGQGDRRVREEAG